MATTQIKSFNSDNQAEVTAANALKVDVTGSGPIPISGTVIADQGAAGVQAWPVDGSGVTQPISAVSLPLPAGASTLAEQQTQTAILQQIEDKFTSSVSSVTSVSSSATNVTLLASNSSRKGALFYNDSVRVCYLKLGATASSTSFTVAMAPQSLFIIDSNPIYNGIVDGIWASANGAMRVTELT